MAKADLRDFDYKKVALLDAAMWRSYYNHQFLKLFFQSLKLMRTQLGLNWILTFRLAFYSSVAAAQYRLKKGREDYGSVLNSLVLFYRLISNSSTEPFDYRKTAELELEWWDIHRYPKKYKKSLEQSVADAIAAMYGKNPGDFKDYAHNRAVAMMLPNHEGDKQAKPVDWQKIEDLLTKSWSAAHKAAQN